MKRLSVLISCCFLLVSGVALAQKAKTYSSPKLKDVQAVIKQAKVVQSQQVGDSLSSPEIKTIGRDTFYGPAGPFKKAYTYVTVSEGGFALWIAGNQEGEWKLWSPAARADGMITVEAMFFDDVQGDGFVEVFVLHSWMKGSMDGAWTNYEVEALEWDQKTNTFVNRSEWFEGNIPMSAKDHTHGFTTAKEVRKYLKSKKFKKKLK